MKIKDMSKKQKDKVINCQCPLNPCEICFLRIDGLDIQQKYGANCVSLLLKRHPRLKIVREFNVNMRKVR